MGRVGPLMWGSVVPKWREDSRLCGKLHVCVSQLFVALIKISEKNNLEEEEFILAHCFRGLSPW